MARTRFYISHRFIHKSAYFVAFKNDYSWSHSHSNRRHYSHHVIRFSTFANNFHSTRILFTMKSVYFLHLLADPRPKDFTHARLHDEISLMSARFEYQRIHLELKFIFRVGKFFHSPQPIPYCQQNRRTSRKTSKFPRQQRVKAKTNEISGICFAHRRPIFN